MNILMKCQWIDYVLTYLITAIFLYITVHIEPLFFFGFGVFAYYLKRSTIDWLFKTEQISTIVIKMSEPFMKKSGNDTVTGMQLMSIYATLSTLTLSPIFLFLTLKF